MIKSKVYCCMKAYIYFSLHACNMFSINIRLFIGKKEKHMKLPLITIGCLRSPVPYGTCKEKEREGRRESVAGIKLRKSGEREKKEKEGKEVEGKRGGRCGTSNIYRIIYILISKSDKKLLSLWRKCPKHYRRRELCIMFSCLKVYSRLYIYKLKLTYFYQQ